MSWLKNGSGVGKKRKQVRADALRREQACRYQIFGETWERVHDDSTSELITSCACEDLGTYSTWLLEYSFFFFSFSLCNLYFIITYNVFNIHTKQKHPSNLCQRASLASIRGSAPFLFSSMLIIDFKKSNLQGHMLGFNNYRSIWELSSILEIWESTIWNLLDFELFNYGG